MRNYVTVTMAIFLKKMSRFWHSNVNVSGGSGFNCSAVNLTEKQWHKDWESQDVYWYTSISSVLSKNMESSNISVTFINTWILSLGVTKTLMMTLGVTKTLMSLGVTKTWIMSLSVTETWIMSLVVTKTINWHPCHCCKSITGMSDLPSNRERLTPNGTHLGLHKIWFFFSFCHLNLSH